MMKSHCVKVPIVSGANGQSTSYQRNNAFHVDGVAELDDIEATFIKSQNYIFVLLFANFVFFCKKIGSRKLKLN